MERLMHGKDRLFVVIRRYGPPYDPQKPLEAQSDWEKHRAFINKLDSQGVVPLAGPLGESGEVLLVMRARDPEQIQEYLAADPWSQSGILSTMRIVEWHLRHGEVR